MNNCYIFVLLALVLIVIAKESSQASIQPRITNGHEAEPHSAPYIVSLKHWGQHNCGGSIINKEWVLTAAHCVGSDTTYTTCVAAGLHNPNNVYQKRVQNRCIDQIYIHEQFGNTGQPEPYDIALLHMSSPFKFNKYVQPIALPSADKIHEGKVTLYGWGQTSSNRNFPLPNKLQTASMNLIPYNICKRLSPFSALHPTNVCTDTMNAGIAGCSGDSGGPLIKELNGTPELVGIVSWGPVLCGKSSDPSVYTRVSAFIDWIASKQAKYKRPFNIFE